MGLFGRGDCGIDPSAAISPTFTYGGRPPRPDGLPAQCTAEVNPRPAIVGSASSIEVPGDGVAGFFSRTMQQAQRAARYRQMLSGGTTARGTMGARPTGNSVASRTPIGQPGFPQGSRPQSSRPQGQGSLWGSALRELREDLRSIAEEFRDDAAASRPGAPDPWTRGIAGGAAPEGFNRGIAGGGTPDPWARGVAGGGTGGAGWSAPQGGGNSFADAVNAARRAAQLEQQRQSQGGNGPSIWGRSG